MTPTGRTRIRRTAAPPTILILVMLTASAAAMTQHKAPERAPCEHKASQHRHGIRDATHTDSLDKLKHFVHCARSEKVKAKIRDILKERKELIELRREVTPYPGPNGTWWALPYTIVYCESGADYHVGFAGAYGLLAATWQQWAPPEFTARWSVAGDAPPYAQDIVAHEVWVDVGPSGWECKA